MKYNKLEGAALERAEELLSRELVTCPNCEDAGLMGIRTNVPAWCMTCQKVYKPAGVTK